MYAWIQHLIVQQTTAPELATFLVLVTAASVLTAMLAYTIIMTVAWATRLRTTRSWWNVVFPSVTTLRQNWPGYVLAVITSVVLALTLAAKNELVDQVLATPASDYVDNPMFARLFPLGRVPTGADMRIDRPLNVAVRAVAGADLSDLVRGPLGVGRAEGVRSLLLAAAKVTIDGRGSSTLTRLATGLKVACFMLMLVYVVWITVDRIRALAKPESEVPELQAGIGGRLVMVGVCLALLLANPLQNPTAELLADSALAAARVAPSRTPLLDSLVTRGIAGQTDVLITGTMSLDAVARRSIEELTRRVETSVEQLRVLDLTTKADAARLAAETARLDAIASALDSLGRRSLLLVVAGAGRDFTVQGRPTPFSAKGVGAGLYWVSPGRYVVTSRSSTAQNASIGIGQHVVVLLAPRGPVVE